MNREDSAADILQSYFERSASLVHSAFERLEKTYLTPAIGHASLSFRSRPIFSSFIAVFFALAFLPTVSFIGFSLSTFGTLTFLALAGSFLASTVIVGVAGFLLVCTLAVLFLISFVLTGSILAVFLFARLLALVRTDGPRLGMTEWTKETKTRLYQGETAVKAVISAESGTKVEYDHAKEDDDDSHSNVSVGSTVVVNSGTDTGSLEKDLPVLVKQEPESY